MLNTVKTKSGRIIILPTDEEDAAIIAAALSDPDARPLSDVQLKSMRPMGRPKTAHPKAPLTMRVDANVLAAMRATGQGWQTRVNALLGEAVASGKF